MIEGASSKPTPMSPRRYQFEPTSTVIGASEAGIVSGGAAPNRSAALAGARIRLAKAAARKILMRSPRNGAPVRLESSGVEISLEAGA